MNTIADIRKDYKLKSFSETDAAANAITQFTAWWKDALASEIDEVNAFTLATATKEGKPSARIVLLKGYDERGFVFFTNYESHKGKTLAENPQASMVFFWKELERQIRVEGTIEKVSAAESDAYFFSRPAGSQLGAWASPQSSVIDSRNIIEENVKKYEAQFAVSPITRPPHWGGYRLVPQSIEFWQGRPSRLHDRLQYSLQKNGEWKMERLAP
jgi:pyridoxamine 5'-phosphate oxidase